MRELGSCPDSEIRRGSYRPAAQVSPLNPSQIALNTSNCIIVRSSFSRAVAPGCIRSKLYLDLLREGGAS